MGNANSNDFNTGHDDPNLLLNLVRYWSTLIESADNLSTVSRKKGYGDLKRPKSNVRKQRTRPVDSLSMRRTKKVTRKNSIIVQNGTKLSRRVSVKNVTHIITSDIGKNLDFLKTIPEDNFDWKTKTYEEIEKMKEIVQWKEFHRMEDIHLPIKPEARRRFRRKRKKKDDARSWNEMWTLSEKSVSSEYNSIGVERDTYDDVGVASEYEDPINQSSPEKMFWKTSKMSLPEVKLLPKSDYDSAQSRNMLWRSSKDIQRVGKQTDACLSPCSSWESETKKPNREDPHNYDSSSSVKSYNVKEIGNMSTLGRKARLSRWTFLRAEANEESASGMERQRKPPQNPLRYLGPAKKNVKRKSSFRVPQKNYSTRASQKKHQNGKGNKRWGLFRNFRSGGSVKSDQVSEDYEMCNCSCCSCENCQENEGGGSVVEVISLGSCHGEMAPNSEEDPRIAIQNRNSWTSDISDKEPQRPPVYNPEDYALSLKKWGRKANAGMQLPLYVSQSTGSIERISAELTRTMQNKRQSSPSTKSSSSSKNGEDKQSKKDRELTLKLEKKDSKNKENINLGSKDGLNKDYRNPIMTLAPQSEEMSLRQFSSVTELLGKLKVDLRLAFPSFVQEFVGDPVDGVTLLLELLRAVQLSQASQQQRCPPQVLRRALLDEHSCLVCLKHCLRCPDASRRLASSPAGLFTLAVCIMSNVTKSRIIALELLTKACETPANGHKPVSEALSTLRLRFGEPVRFRFLVGMLNSAGAVELLAAGMRFINSFLETAPSVQQRVYIQAELEQAGFDSRILRKTLPSNSETVKAELNRWDKNYFDVAVLESKVTEVDTLRDKVQLLEKRIQILQEEKGILLSLEQCLKERCSELEEEVSIKTSTTTLTKSTAHIKPFRNYANQQQDYNNYKRNTEKDESTPAEDEGISSSEQELSQDEDYIKGTITYSVQSSYDPIINTSPPDPPPPEPKKPPRANPPSEKIINVAPKPPRNVKNNKMKETNVDDGNEIVEDEEEETTIDEVIEELRNIVNDAETEAYGKKPEVPAKPPKTYLRKKVTDPKNLTPEEKTRTYTKSTVENFEEAEIVPSILLPQPPRRTRSLVHIFLPGREYDGPENGKNEFFDEDTDSESSDSLLTATREKRPMHKNCQHRSLDVSDSFNSFSSVNTRTLFIKQQEEYEDSEVNIKLGYEERNIDEEEIKRRHLKTNIQNIPDVKKHGKKNEQGKGVQERLIDGFNERLIERPVPSPYEKSTSFQGIKSCITGSMVNQSPFVRRTQRFIPIPVKRSQTFHIATPEGNRPTKRTEIKPKPKMGVSGLSSDLKLRNDHGKYQNIDYKKNVDKKSDVNDRYLRKMSKDKKSGEKPGKNEKSNPLLRRGSFDGLFFVTEMKQSGKKSKKDEHPPVTKSNSNMSDVMSSECSDKKSRSKSLERMDDGLDSLVDIVISPDKKPKKNEWNIELNKNIGPRTRRSLAESSLFTQPQINDLNKEGSPKPPQPAQRTSLTRNNSSSTPLHLPVEIKLAPNQPRQPINLYSFGLKSAKSEDSLLSSTPPKRYPPDGSSSPMDFPGSNGNEMQKMYEASSRKNLSSSKNDDSPIYATPVKQSKLQKFFGNPKFENTMGNEIDVNQKYFESNYACTPGPKAVSPMPRNIQNIASSTTQMVKNLINNQQKSNPPNVKQTDAKEQQGQSKLNFFLGTYQSQPVKNNDSPKSSVNSPNSFNNAFMIKRGHLNAGMYSGTRDSASNNQGYKSPSAAEVVSPRQAMTNGSHAGVMLATKVTDSPSGLY